jgi:guanylate kinase
LERRLRTRGTDADEVVERRLTIARREILAVREFDYAVVNDDLEETLSAVHGVLDAERRRDTAEARTRYGREAALERLGPGFDNLR